MFLSENAQKALCNTQQRFSNQNIQLRVTQKDMDKQKEKTSRAKYKCSPELAELLATVNAVPPGVVLPSYRDAKDKFESEYFLEHNVRYENMDESSRLHMMFEVFDYCFKDFFDQDYKKQVFEYWFSRLKETLSQSEKTYLALFYSLIETYEYVRETRRDVNHIIRYVSELNNKSPILHLYDTNLHTPLAFSQQNGETRAKLLGFAKVIESIDLERLRACKTCGRVFWAKRKDSETCQTVCFNALRQRRHREQNKEAINARRKENYQFKKQQKERAKNGEK